jgi:diaminopimelate epimerase
MESWCRIPSVRSVPFVKSEACGNDFLLVSDEYVPLARSAEGARLAAAICHRLRGVGADGLIVWRKDWAKDPDFAMTLYNSDGSAAEISGNGLRCLGAVLVDWSLVQGPQFVVTTDAGRTTLALVSREGNRFSFRANLGRPRIGPNPRETLRLEGESFEATILSMGNPHCVLFTETFDPSELRRIGPRLESHPRFPEKTNVELVEILSRTEVRMGIWERGVGETASSGTGSAATAVASIVKGLVRSPVDVHCPGGTIGVEWSGPEADVFITGEAVVVAEGMYWFEEERS